MFNFGASKSGVKGDRPRHTHPRSASNYCQQKFTKKNSIVHVRVNPVLPPSSLICTKPIGPLPRDGHHLALALPQDDDQLPVL